ncbi:MAG TPA: PDZ domain-containing protein [Planctomycetota bacterium]|jgi:C-terminal processing protease CtpA/Prc|nr:PDZ domain-containing protein [Planctomycetota bacterium]
MKSVCTLLLGFAFAATAVAQDQDKDALKRELLKEVEKRLKSEDDKLLKDIEKLIDQELKGGKAPQAGPKAEAKPEPKVAPKDDAPKRKARGYMGVRPTDLTDEEKKDLGIKSGIKVAEVVPGGPAEKAGLKADDVIVTIDGKAMDSPQDVPSMVQAAGAGATLKIEYLRDGKKKNANVLLAVHPADAQPAPQDESKPKEQGKGDEDLRERVKKFLQKKEAPQDESKPKGKAKPAPAPDEGGADDLFALDEDMFEQFKDMFEKFGVDPEQFFEKGKDGKYRLNDQMKELFKNFNFDKFKDLLPKGEEPEAPAPAPAPKKEPKRAEPKKAEPKAPRPWLGVQPEDLPDELRAQLDLPEGEGLLVTDVLPGSPAEKAGLKKNDILTKIDGKSVKGEESLAKFMSTAKAGQEATLTVLRKAKEQTIKVTIGEKRD